jgi:hypothetical protein
MAIIERDLEQAENRMQTLREAGYAVAARYDRRASRVIVNLNTGVQLSVPTRNLEGLTEAPEDDLAEIEISPAGLGLYWPKLDADVYIPSLLQGIFGSKKWMAALLGASGGRSTSTAKTAAARRNGHKGGRPRRVA